MSETLTSNALMDVNARFVREHLGERWLAFKQVDSWKGHRERVIRAAREQGLHVAAAGRTVMFFRQDQCVGGLEGLQPSLVSSFARSVSASKAKTRLLLEQSGVPVPAGRAFASAELQDAVDYMQSAAATRFVLKPVDGSGGSGVTTGLVPQDARAVEAAWAEAKSASKKGRLVVEEEIPGLDVRVYVVDRAAVSAAVRIPPFVYGDGVRTVRALYEDLRAARYAHAYLNTKTIAVVDEVLSAQGCEWESVPAVGEVVFLNGTANISRGGIAVDVTKAANPHVLRLAEKAAAAVPGLNTAGVDILVPDLVRPDQAKVIEMNTSPNLSVHDYPAYGEAQGVAERIVEAMLRHIGVTAL